MQNGGKIMVPQPGPVAVINVTMMPDGQVGVGASGQINQFMVNGMLECAKQLLMAKIAEAAKGPQVQLAPPGLRLAP